MFHLALHDSYGPLTTLLSAQKLFPLFLLQRWLVNNISPLLWILVAETTHNQLEPRNIQPYPVFLSFCSNQIHQAKSLKNIYVFLSNWRALMLQGLLEHQRGNTSPSSWLVSNPNFAQPCVPWGSISQFPKLPAGWEGNVSRCECRSRQPRVCLGWTKRGSSLDSELRVSQLPPAWLPRGVTEYGVSPLCHEHRRNSPEYCFPGATWR